MGRWSDCAKNLQDHSGVTPAESSSWKERGPTGAKSERFDVMTWKQFAPTSDLADHKVGIPSSLFVGPIALAMLAITVIGFSTPYLQFDLATKIQKSLVHKPSGFAHR
jgi:hypothetical protein